MNIKIRTIESIDLTVGRISWNRSSVLQKIFRFGEITRFFGLPEETAAGYNTSGTELPGRYGVNQPERDKLRHRRTQKNLYQFSLKKNWNCLSDSRVTNFRCTICFI